MHDVAAHHAPPTSFIRKHVFSLDHKVIGKQYYALALVAALAGMVLSWAMRIHLGWTNAAIPGLQLLSKNGAPGGVPSPPYLPARGGLTTSNAPGVTATPRYTKRSSTSKASTTPDRKSVV